MNQPFHLRRQREVATLDEILDHSLTGLDDDSPILHDHDSSLDLTTSTSIRIPSSHISNLHVCMSRIWVDISVSSNMDRHLSDFFFSSIRSCRWLGYGVPPEVLVDLWNAILSPVMLA